MFWILEIFPDWTWWFLLIAGLSGYFLARLVPLTQYQLPIKIFSGILVCVVIFIFGLLYANGTWKQAAEDLQAQVAAAEAKSQLVNEVIKERVVTKTQIVRQRGASTVEYITREVTRHDAACTIPPEFINAHNRAAETPP